MSITDRSTASTDHRQAGDAGRLRLVLRLNAASSFGGGVVAAAVPNTLDEVLGTGHPGWVRLVGVGLILFAGVVFLASRADTGRIAKLTRDIVIADVSWVLVSVVTIAAGWFDGVGNVVVGAVAVMVATWATLQHRHAGRLGSSDA